MSRLDRKIARSVVVRTARLRVPRAVVSISFDDIPVSAATVGARILEQENVRGTFFVASNLLSKRFGPWQFADMAQVVGLHEAGHEIGCHTRSHADGQILAPRDLQDDIERNCASLTCAMPGLQIETFAYPYGSVGCRQKPRVMDLFRSARGTHPAVNLPKLDTGQLGSYTLNDANTPQERLRELLAEAIANNGWLILHTHDVADNPTPEGCSPGLLRQAIRLSREAGCPVLPIKDVITKFTSVA